jgi:hypothetical protein
MSQCATFVGGYTVDPSAANACQHCGQPSNTHERADMRVGQARKRDANEEEIVDALRRVGAHVFRISEPGAPDLLVAWRGRWIPMEVKSPTGILTVLQEGSIGAAVYPIVRTVDEALKALGATR